MGRWQQWTYRAESEEFPRDFLQRLERFRYAAGLTWLDWPGCSG